MINAINLTSLRNAEYIQFCKNFASLVQTNNPAALFVQPQYDTFVGKISELEILFKKSNSSPITPEIQGLDIRRGQAIKGLVGVINGFVYYFEPAIAAAATALQNNLKLYPSGIARENYQSETAILTNIITDWENKPELINALITLNLVDWKDELKSANTLFNEKYLARTQEYAAAPSDKLGDKRNETNLSYNDLKKYLEANALINNSPTYTKVISELNAHIDQYNALLNSRQTNTNPKPPAKPQNGDAEQK